MKQLTERQTEVADFIKKFFEDNGYAPSVRDVANNFGFSVKAAHDHLKALEKKNIIRTAENLPRAMELLSRNSDSNEQIKVPVLGTIAAGVPLLSEQNFDYYVPISAELLKNSTEDQIYALKVQGDSMIEDGINDGDLAILRHTSVASNGDIVAASIGEDFGITLKHFYKTPSRIELRPANSQYEPLISNHCEIYGKLLMIIRQYTR